MHIGNSQEYYIYIVSICDNDRNTYMSICEYMSMYVSIMCMYVGTCVIVLYSQTSLIRAYLIRMPPNPNTVLGNRFYHFLCTLIQ